MYASVRRRDRRQKAQAEEWITIFLVYDIASLFYYVSVLSPVPALRDIFLYWYGAIYSLFVLKVPLNPKQTNKTAVFFCCCLSCLFKFLAWLCFSWCLILSTIVVLPLSMLYFDTYVYKITYLLTYLLTYLKHTVYLRQGCWCR